MTLALPSNRQEAWRWSDLSGLPDFAARERRALASPLTNLWLDCAVEGPRLLFVDGKLAAEESSLGPLQIGALEQAPDHALARHAGEGWKLRLDAGHAPLGLVQIVHAATGAADHLAGEIILGEDAQASVVETFLGEGWTNRFTRIRLARSARLMLSRRITSGGFVSLTEDAEVGEGASLTVATLAAGTADTRLDANIRLTGDGAFAEAGGALLARGKQRHDANLVLRHEQPNGVSRQVWRSVADDRATCSVAARVEVARGAQKTDGEQSLKGLLLARTARVNAKPELEIYADDVKCAHGATVGELNRDALFYLASRGVPETEAKALLTSAFVQDALARVGEEAVRKAFEVDAQAWLAQESFVPSEVEGRT
ncbi:MAG TPA: SufD family Fe-S cluster assembly protein [Allosphingosinicella sp.]